MAVIRLKKAMWIWKRCRVRPPMPHLGVARVYVTATLLLWRHEAGGEDAIRRASPLACRRDTFRMYAFRMYSLISTRFRAFPHDEERASEPMLEVCQESDQFLCW